MAQPTVYAGTKLIIMIEDDASPATFTAPCGLTTRTANIKAATSTTIIPDCANEEAPAWESTDVTSLSFEASGSGVMAGESFSTWNNWAINGINKRARVKILGQGYWEGDFKCTDLRFTGTRGEKVTVDVTIKADGAVAFTVAST